MPRIIANLPGVHEAIRSVGVSQEAEPAFNAEVLAALGGDDRAAMTWAHLRKLVYQTGSIALWYLPWVLGHFLLGMAAGKARVFVRDGAGHLKLFRRLLAIGIVLVVIGVALIWVMRPGPGGARAMPPPSRIALGAVIEVVTLGMVSIYISAVVLLMQRRLPRRLLMIVAPVGRMPLTTYLSQSLIATFIFYGWGLGWIGRVDMGDGVAIAAGIFVVQVVIAHLWLRRFRTGPMEWLWRALAYRAPRRDGHSCADARASEAA